MRALTILKVAAFLLLPFLMAQTVNESPFYSSHATYVYSGKTAKSPDGKKNVTVRVLNMDADDFPTAVSVQTPRGTLKGKVNFGLNAQVLWSGDSKAFALTGSQTGANGQYRTTVFVLREKSLVAFPLTNLIERAFGHPVKCGWPEVPNVAAVKWLNRSKQLLVAAQIYPHSNCDSFGTFKGYVIDIAQKRVIRIYNQLEVKGLFAADIGPWLKDADDGCIRNPRSCYVMANHPELKSSK